MEINYDQLTPLQARWVWGIGLGMVTLSYFSYTILKASFIIVFGTAIILTMMGR